MAAMWRGVPWVVLGAALAGCGQPPKPAPKRASAPVEITGTDLDDRPMRLSEYRGKVVLLDFWQAQ